jgi:rod shape determining protein RodA
MLVLFMYGLLIFGVFVIESAARHVPVADPAALAKYGSAGLVFAAKQKTWILLGSVAFFAAALVDYRWIRWLAIPGFALALALMVATLQFGNKVHQLEFGGLTFQPAQMGITAGILLIAWLIQDLPRLHRVFGGSFSRIGVIAVGAGLPFLVAGAMGDTGSALVWVPVTVVALLIGGVAFRHILFMLLIGAGVLPIMYFVVLPSMDSGERAINRVDLWLKMQQGQEVDILDQGYSPHWATVAVGKSGWKGVGWNAPPEKNSVTARGKPSGTTNHNDYIFVVIAEELGFRGTLALLCAYAVLMVQCLLVAYYSRDVTGRLLAALVLTLIFAHVFESIGMCVLLLPVTGIPLPFISYSGTFVVICMFLMGLVQSVWIHRFDRPGRLAVSTG